MRNLRFIILLLCFLVTDFVSGQTMVYLEHSETLNFDQDRLANAQILKGNVCFRHEGLVMHCDSAYFYDQENSLDAFGHVRFNQGDTLRGYGDKLYYNGNTRLARLCRHVKLVHGKHKKVTTLTTDSMNYDRNANLAYYYTGGKIVDELNKLSSVWGQYNPSTEQAIFSNKVHLENDKFIMDCDTLLYSTETKVADLVSPTRILYEEETTIQSDNGWYNTRTEESMLLNRSTVEHTNGKKMTGDSIFYNKATGYGRIMGNMEMIDTVQMATLYGNFGEMFNDGERGYATDSALMVDWSDSTMYGYMHADSLFIESIPDSIMVDSVMQDTTFRKVRAYHGVRVYREDMQMVCDSATYWGKDSVLTLYNQPICWSDSNQISADIMYVYMKDGTVDHAYGVGNTLSVRQNTEEYFDQMRGKEMTAYVRDGELRQVDVNGNALTVFYPREEDGSWVGLNTTESSFIRMYLYDKKIDHIVITSESTGTLYPMDQVPDGKNRLEGFFWADQERPKKPGDVFERPAKTDRGESHHSASKVNKKK